MRSHSATCFLVSDPGTLLPQSEIEYYHFITDVLSPPIGPSCPESASSSVLLSPGSSSSESTCSLASSSAPISPIQPSPVLLSPSASNNTFFLNVTIYFHSKDVQNVFGSHPLGMKKKNCELNETEKNLTSVEKSLILSNKKKQPTNNTRQSQTSLMNSSKTKHLTRI